MCVLRIFTINPLLHRRGLPDEHGMEATPHFLTNFVMQETRFHNISLSIYLHNYLSISIYLSIYLSTHLSRFHRLRSPYQSNCYANWTSTNYTDYIDPKHTYSRTVRFW